MALLMPRVNGFMARLTKSTPKRETARLTRECLLFDTTTTAISAIVISSNHARTSGVPSGLFHAIKVLSKSTKTA